jgi:hypothetical protein
MHTFTAFIITLQDAVKREVVSKIEELKN